MNNKNIKQPVIVTVIILNYQSYNDTIDYVSSLYRQKMIDLRILIVDNCSPNNSYELLKKYFIGSAVVDVIKSERNGGYAYGNNYGLRHLKDAEIDYIIISNNDVLIDNELLIFRMISEYRNLDKVAFVSPVMNIGNVRSRYPAWPLPTLRDDIIGSLRCFQALFGKNKSVYLIAGTVPIKTDCVPGSLFMGKSKIFFDVGLMDENTFLYMEEAILGYKVKELGLHNYVIPTITYEHATSKTISSQISKVRMRRHLIDSRIYYHKFYRRTGVVGTTILRLLFWTWIIETYFYMGVMTRLRKISKILFSTPD